MKKIPQIMIFAGFFIFTIEKTIAIFADYFLKPRDLIIAR